jgi:hypothetical protein
MRVLARRSARTCAALLALAVLAPDVALAADKSTVPVQVAIQTPGSLVKVADMNFGSFAQANGTATIVMTPAQTAVCTVSGPIVRSGPCQAATFSVVGRKNWIVRVRDMNNNLVTLNGPGGKTMTLTALTIGINNDMTPINGGGQSAGLLGRYRIDNDTGISNFYIGGTLNIPAALNPGVYQGTVVIQVQYN